MDEHDGQDFTPILTFPIEGEGNIRSLEAPEAQ